MSIGDNIKQLRIEKNLTQKKLSELSGISEVMISQYERGIRSPKHLNLRKLAKVLDPIGNRLIDKDLPFAFLDPDEDPDDYRAPIRTIQDFGVDFNEHKLIGDYRLLNEEGKTEAIKRVEELTEITKYSKYKE